jgi:ketosteroid isomerase-like protein
MPEENVEIVRGALEAFGAGDVEALVRFADPEIEFEPHLAMLEGNYEGHSGVRKFMADANDFARVHRIEVGDVRDLGDKVVVLGTFHIRWESGLEQEAPFGIVARLRGGLIVQLRDYGDKHEALQAAGLEE